MNVNRKLKDSVFTKLFSEPDTLRELYGALEGVTLSPDVPVTINTLSDAIFLEQINDLAFTVDNRLVILIEHQSTINPNMALRLLMYAGRVYEKILEAKNLFGSKQLVIPRPEFIVLYNGAAPYPDEKTLMLSDMFEKAADLLGSGKERFALELVVKVYNINHGHNQPLVQKSKNLNWYSAFINKAREYKAETNDDEKAIKMAITYCIERNILKDFLEAHASEVVNMLLTEWSTVEYGEVQREEGREEGREESARNMLRDNMPPDKVAQYTGLPLETVKGIASTLGTQTTGK
jgi:predicted transposase YdaD